jgi:hypothetical protein
MMARGLIMAVMTGIACGVGVAGIVGIVGIA